MEHGAQNHAPCPMPYVEEENIYYTDLLTGG